MSAIRDWNPLQDVGLPPTTNVSGCPYLPFPTRHGTWYSRWRVGIPTARFGMNERLARSCNKRSLMFFSSTLYRASFVLAALMIGGCGGGGDDGGSTAGSGNSPPPAAPPTSSNAAPSITGQPATSVLASQAYSFQPAASDVDGDALTFTGSNLPDWVTLNPSTGRLSGTPTSAEVGTYSGITLTVSDGTATTSLAPFAIAVTETANGAATLSWVPPTENADGSALTNLAGYEIRYGTDQNDLSQTVSLTNPSLSTYMIENLTAGTWYFAIASINSSGVTSNLSNVASKTIG